MSRNMFTSVCNSGKESDRGTNGMVSLSEGSALCCCEYLTEGLIQFESGLVLLKVTSNWSLFATFLPRSLRPTCLAITGEYRGEIGEIPSPNLHTALRHPGLKCTAGKTLQKEFFFGECACTLSSSRIPNTRKLDKIQL